MPRDLWVLPWAEKRYPRELAKLRARFPSDFGRPTDVYRSSPRIRGNAYTVGEFRDEWGCVFTSIHEGIIGEVKKPQIARVYDWHSVQPPYETLPTEYAASRDRVNRSCAESDKFILANCCPRPWERYQFLRGTMNAMMDVMQPDRNVVGLLQRIHSFHIAELQFWAATDVDGILFMDDWGAQQQLLIPPRVWRALFKPLYRDYCQIAHARSKFAFMHSDGCITEIVDDLVEVGVDALNSQLFTMDMADLARRAKGQITFWGEIDRQHVMPATDPQVARDAVRKVAQHLYDPQGGVIAQFELGPGSRPENAVAIFEEWEQVQREALCPTTPSPANAM